MLSHVSLYRCLALGLFLVRGALGGEVIYQTQFETPQFVAGNLTGQGGWTVGNGTATVVAGTSVMGNQSVEAAAASYQMAVTSSASVVWIDAWYRDPGTSTQPVIPEEERSAVLFFSATGGLLALDGDGEGHGVFVTVDEGIAGNQFVRITLRMDYANALYDVWVDGVLKKSNLGFKNNTVTSMSLVERETDATSYFDGLCISTWGLDSDSDGDTLADLDEVNRLGTNPSLADTDSDGKNDYDEVVTGTDPTDGSSFFSPASEMLPNGKMRFTFHAKAGRTYTLQSNLTLQEGLWIPVSGMENLTGTEGQLMTLDVPVSGPRQFFRIRVNYTP